MAKYPGLMRRGERWWLRVVVPRPLRRTLGRAQIWRSLGTSDRQEAISRYFPARSQLTALFDQARRANYTPDSLLRMAEWVDRLDRPRHARNPFSPDQLQLIVAHLPGELPYRRWIILLGLFTGARLNELCGLAIADIAELDHVPVFLIRPDTRGLKTAAASAPSPFTP